MNMNDYVDDKGNFTHVRIKGTKEQLEEFVQKYRDSERFKSKADSQKILMEMFVFPSIVKTNMVPQGLIMDLIMPPVDEDFKFKDLKPGATITFALPPKFKSPSN